MSVERSNLREVDLPVLQGTEEETVDRGVGMPVPTIDGERGFVGRIFQAQQAQIGDTSITVPDNTLNDGLLLENRPQIA